MKYNINEKQKDFYKMIKSYAEENNKKTFNFFKYAGDSKKVITITRKELLEKSLNIAAKLKSENAYKGDRLVIFDTQTPDNVLSVTASMLSGTIFTFVPPPVDENKTNRFLSVIKYCEPKFILCSSILENALTNLLEKLRKVENYKKLVENIKIINIENCNNSSNFIPDKLEADDVIYIQYSSGSTSAPKGVMITYGNVVSIINNTKKIYNPKKYFGWVPFFHNIGLMDLIITPLIDNDFESGILSPAEFLANPISWFQGISDFKADGTVAPNSVYESFPKLVSAKMLKDKNIDISTLEKLANGSEVVSYESMNKFVKAYEEFGMNIGKFMTGYGLSETTCGLSLQCTYSKADNLIMNFESYKEGKLVVAKESDSNTIEFVPCGEIVPEIEVKIVNPDTLEECKDNEFGEIWVTGPSVAKGYYKNEEATKVTFEEKLRDRDIKYLRTGDLGIIYNNYVYVTGRIKELIIINGNNILPNDIDLKIKEVVTELKDVKVIPFSVIKDKKEKLVILLSAAENIIRKFCNKEILDKINICILDNFEITPYDIVFIKDTDVPKADSGKISIMSTAKLYSENTLKVIRCNESKNNFKEIIKFTTETEERLANIIQNEFSVKANRDDNLLSLGMDSLRVVELTTNIEKNFNVRIPVAFIFANSTIEKISNYIDRDLNGEDLSKLEKDKSYLYNEVELDEKIIPCEYENKNPEMKNIFLTGSTGFLGAYLIDRFIKENNSVKVYCHVRAKDEEAGFKRIVENMKYYKLWNEDYKEYIIPVIGSLDKPLLGIDKDKYEYLINHIDTIYHNGAILNFIYPYENLKEVNVNGTKRTLEFACTGKAKYYNYISSYSVYDNPSHFNKECSEDDNFEDCKGYYLSYSESKWVAEKIINIAKSRGLRASVYRPGEITGSSNTGIWKFGDSVSRNIKGIMQYGICADINMNVHMVQVDYVASAIASISKKGEAYGKSYNLLNPMKITLKQLAKIINKDVQIIEYEEWRKLLFNSDTSNPMKLLEELFKTEKKNPKENISVRYGDIEPRLSMKNTEEMLKGTGIECKTIDEELIKKYLENFK